MRIARPAIEVMDKVSISKLRHVQQDASGLDTNQGRQGAAEKAREVKTDSALQMDFFKLAAKVYDNGQVRARRKDRKPLTDEDRDDACRLADSLPGITVRDVLRIFAGVKPWEAGLRDARTV